MSALETVCASVTPAQPDGQCSWGQVSVPHAHMHNHTCMATHVHEHVSMQSSDSA